MKDKIRAYLDGLFAAVPANDAVKEAKEELYTGMCERYDDNIAEGMDEQEAYDSVIDSIGDIAELFDTLHTKKSGSGANWHEQGAAAGQKTNETWHKAKDSIEFNVNEFVKSVTEFTGGLFSGLFGQGSAPASDLHLVNTRVLPLTGITTVSVGYVAEPIVLLRSATDELTIKEYMNRDDPTLYAGVAMMGDTITVKNGRRQGMFGLRSRVEVYMPANWQGSLSLSTISGPIRSDEDWSFVTLSAKSVSGGVEMNSVTANMLQLSSTSGPVKLARGAGTMELHSVSGPVRVETALGSGSFKSTSGGVRVHFEDLRGHVEASSVSGGVRLGLPESASFEFDARSVTGGIHTAFDDRLTFQRRNQAHGFVGVAPYFHVRISTTSGGIHVND